MTARWRHRVSEQIGLPNALRRSRRAKRVHGLLPTPSILPLHRCRHPCGCHPRHHPLHRRPHRHPRPPPLSPHSLHHHRPHPPSPSPQLHPRHLERRRRRSDGRSKTRRRKCKMGVKTTDRASALPTKARCTYRTKACSAYATQDQDAPLADARQLHGTQNHRSVQSREWHARIRHRACSPIQY